MEPEETVQSLIQEAKDIIDILPEYDVRALLGESVEKDPEAAGDIVEKYRDRREKYSWGQSRQEIMAVRPVYEPSGNADTLSYEYAGRLKDVLSKYADEMLSAGMYGEANELVIAVYKRTDIGSRNDFNGVRRYIMDDCLSYWRRIQENCWMPLKLEIMDRLKEVSDTPLSYNTFYTDIRRLIYEGFTEPECLARKLEWTEEEIQSFEDVIDEYGEPDIFMKPAFEKAAVRKLDLMKALGSPQADLDETTVRYRAFPEVRMWQAGSLAAAGDTDEAIQVLLDSRCRDCKNRQALTKETSMLVRLYKSAGKTELCRKELEYLMFELNYPGMFSDDLMPCVLALKDVCSPEEWVKHREKILKSTRFISIHRDLMAKEGLYDRLLESVTSSGEDLYAVRKYEEILKPMYPGQLMMFYANYAIRKAPDADTRIQYAELCSCLTSLASYPGGDAVAKTIAMQWKDSYPRRRAFMDEIKKAGFWPQNRAHITR